MANPGKIIAAPVNYQKHLDEVRDDPQLHGNNPGHTFTIQTAGLFLKATSSLVGPGEGIVVRCAERRTDHEVELAVVIGRTASRVSRADALALRRRLLRSASTSRSAAPRTAASASRPTATACSARGS